MERKLIIGMGKSGLACARKLMDQGNSVVVYDKESIAKAEEPEWKKLFKSGDLTYLNDEWSPGDLQKIDEAVISPGIPWDIPFVSAVRDKEIPLVGEIELASRYIKAPMIGITGTNGKTTTTTLVYEILKKSGKSVYLAGNIGYPLMDLADLAGETDVIVVELSSFQLEAIKDFHVNLGMILNITPDHLDRHHTMDAYIQAKKNIFLNSGAKDYGLLNKEDPALVAMAKDLPCKLLYFSTKESVDQGAFLDGERIKLAKDGEIIDLMDVAELKVPGIHNVQNILAAAAAAFFTGISAEDIRAAIQSFTGVEHRIEFVRERDGVVYYNDSKGTNTDAGIIALKAMKSPVILIAGGYDKHADYTDWIQMFFDKVRKVFLIGQTAPIIMEKAMEMGYESLEICGSLEEAVEKSAAMAQRGDVVLLSPACASWGMFENYEVRGEQFKELVNSL